MTTATTDAQASQQESQEDALAYSADDYSTFSQIVDELRNRNMVEDTEALADLMAVIENLQVKAEIRERLAREAWERQIDSITRFWKRVSDMEAMPLDGDQLAWTRFHDIEVDPETARVFGSPASSRLRCSMRVPEGFNPAGWHVDELVEFLDAAVAGAVERCQKCGRFNVYSPNSAPEDAFAEAGHPTVIGACSGYEWECGFSDCRAHHVDANAPILAECYTHTDPDAEDEE